MEDKIIKIKGVVQPYTWGGYDFIPSLLGIDNSAKQPFAEYWLGTHRSAPGMLETEEGLQNWISLIEQNPEEHLGKIVTDQYGELPYLLKILDVREMLSIQVHPTKQGAEIGFQEEEERGIPITAVNRNYKDKNHKPEVMIALGEFWLLHGFKMEGDLKKVLSSIPEFTGLQTYFSDGGYKGLYSYVMEMPQAQVDTLLIPLVERELNNTHSKDTPGYWVNKLYDGKMPVRNIDRGIFSIYFFNIVKLQKGEGIFQGSGLPHAYLEGQNVELMVNSDNVLRGGLTPKHIDVGELLKHIDFKGLVPEILNGEVNFDGERNYALPVPDFGISELQLSNGYEYISNSFSAEIYLVLEGEVNCHHLNCKRGEAFVVLADTDYTIRGVSDALLYKAYVPHIIE